MFRRLLFFMWKSELFKPTEGKPQDDDDWDADEPANKRGWDDVPVQKNQGYQPTHKNDGWDDAPVKRNQPTYNNSGWDDQPSEKQSYQTKASEPIAKKHNDWDDVPETTTNKKPGRNNKFIFCK